MWPNPQEIVDFVKFTEEILYGKLHFFVQSYTLMFFWSTPDLCAETTIISKNQKRFVPKVGALKLLMLLLSLKLTFLSSEIIHPILNTF